MCSLCYANRGHVNKGHANRGYANKGRANKGVPDQRGWVSGNVGRGVRMGRLHDTDDVQAENLSIDSHASVGGAGSRGHFILAGPANTKTLR